jgi:hypothetical protein
MDVRVKRAYEPTERSDGYRILIDRLWPRGVSHERARLDAWGAPPRSPTEFRKERALATKLLDVAVAELIEAVRFVPEPRSASSPRSYALASRESPIEPDQAFGIFSAIDVLLHRQQP